MSGNSGFLKKTANPRLFSGFEAPRCRSYGYTALPRTDLHVHISRPRGRLAARRRTDRAGMAEALKAEAQRRAEVNHFYGLIVFASAVARKPTSMGTRS